MLKRIGVYLFPALLLLLCLSGDALAQAEKKVAQAVLIDNTGSLRAQFDDVIMLGKGIVERTHQRGPVSIFNFKTVGGSGGKNETAVVTSVVAWSEDKSLIDNYIDNLFIVSGQTSLKDAINTMAEHLNAKTALQKDAFSDKVIYLLTDGEDRVSKITEKQLIQALKESGIKVYVVGLLRDLDREGAVVRRSPAERATEFLKKLTKETGGRVVFSKSKDNDPDRLLSELFAK